jgi:hypothetical protein
MIIYFYIIAKYIFNTQIIDTFKKLSIFFYLLLIFSTVSILSTYIQLGYYNHIRSNQISYNQSINKKNVILPTIPAPSRKLAAGGVITKTYYLELAPFKDNWYNIQFAKYYGFESVIATYQG